MRTPRSTRLCDCYLPDDHGVDGPVLPIGLHARDLLHDVELGAVPEQRVAGVEIRTLAAFHDEELAAVRPCVATRARVCHRERTGADVRALPDLVVERVARTARAAAERIAALDH